MYIKDNGEQRAIKLKEMCKVPLNIDNDAKFGWELSTALANRTNEKGLATLIFNVNDSQGLIDIYIYANQKYMYSKYTNNAGLVTQFVSESLLNTIARGTDVLVSEEFDNEAYYSIKIYCVYPSTYENVGALLNRCIDLLPELYQKNRI